MHVIDACTCGLRFEPIELILGGHDSRDQVASVAEQLGLLQQCASCLGVNRNFPLRATLGPSSLQVQQLVPVGPGRAQFDALLPAQPKRLLQSQ